MIRRRLEMKKTTIALSIILIALTLAGCAGPASGGIQGGTSTGALPAPTELIIGSLRLEGSAQAVTQQQAADLLPLWQVYKELSASDTSAPQELEALISQIRDSMTPEQLQAIAEMKLTQQDVFTTLQERGITTGNRPQGTGDNGGFTPPQGGIPGAGPGGFPGGDGQSPDPQQIATMQAARSQAGGASRTPSALIEAFIEFLQSRAR